MSQKDKLLAKASREPAPKDFTWDEAVRLMKACGFELHNATGGGSGRMFVHVEKRTKVRLHERHPQNTLLPYMVKQMLEGLRAAGEIK